MSAVDVRGHFRVLALRDLAVAPWGLASWFWAVPLHGERRKADVREEAKRQKVFQKNDRALRAL